MEIILNSTEETKHLAQEIANTLNKGDILALYGDLGSGKTTFTRYLVESLGFEDRVQSPTFIIQRVYTKNKSKENLISGISKISKISKINHFDLYRLTNIEEVLDMGFEDILKEDSLTIIEWPEVIQSYLSKEKTKKMYFEYLDDEKRKVTIK